MIKKLRVRIVAICMLFALIIFSGTVSAIYLLSKNNIENATSAALQSALLSDSVQPELPGKQNYSVPVFVAEVRPSGTVRIYGSNYYSYEDQSALLDIVNTTLKSAMPSGTLEEYQLQFLREDTFFSTKIAFADCSFEQHTLRSLLTTSILICICALLILGALSVLLSYYVTRPISEAWNSQQRFLSDASHELKTPLTVILSSADLLEGNINTENQEYIENIKEESLRMKKLVESMLSLSRMQNTPKLVSASLLDLSDLVTEAVLRFEALSFESGHELVSYIDDGISVKGETAKLDQLLGILLDNAIKYTTPQAPICLRLSRNGRNAVLTIENASQPIPDDQLSHLFDRFYRVDESRTDTSGYGLGLSIAQDIVKLHQGTITCQNGQGTVFFTITLPISSETR